MKSVVWILVICWWVILVVLHLKMHLEDLAEGLKRMISFFDYHSIDFLKILGKMTLLESFIVRNELMTRNVLRELKSLFY
jgi:hypothetical protein